jgi:polysaccharide export outer membrane protein
MTKSRAVAWTTVAVLAAGFTSQAIGQAYTTGSPVAQTTPPIAAGAAADYKVGAGDLLAIQVYRAPDLGETVRVASDGSIEFPSLGKVTVNNLTAADIAAKLVAGLKGRGILVAPSVNVLVTEVRSKVAMVMGAVGRPGEIPLDRPGLTLAAVLARAGATFGTGSGIVTITNATGQGTREQFRIADLVSGAKDRPARAGEILVVQSAPTIYVSGEVGRPGSYPLEPNMTVGQAIAVGGGITPRGSRSRIQLTRKNGTGAATQILNHVKLDTPVMPDDLVTVRQRLF